MSEATSTDPPMPSDSKFPWYLGIIGVYGLVTLAAIKSAECHRNLKKASLRDLGLIGFGAYRAGRVIALDEVTRPLRAPFVVETEEEGQRTEEAREEGLRGALGNLALCSDCMSFWMAVMLTYAFMMAPRSTRVVVAPLALSGIVSLINNATAVLERASGQK